MESLKKNKILIGILVISTIAFLFYQFSGFFNKTDNFAGSDTATEENITQDILLLLNEMQQARIDENLFTSTAWTNLVDYAIVLPSDVPGRSDLFGGSLQSNSATFLNTTTPTPTPTPTPATTTTKTIKSPRNI